MKKLKLQKIFAVFSVMSALALVGGSEAFASFSALNQGTGFNSINQLSLTFLDNFTDTNNNAQIICNDGDGIITTGGNLVLNNNSLGEVLTGNISVEGIFANDANINVLEGGGVWLLDALVGNELTGANSFNSAAALLSQSTSVLNSNRVFVGNDIFSHGISGNNLVQNNGGSGLLGTGNILGELGAENIVNSNFLSLLSAGSGTLLSQVGNSLTGAMSVNNASLTACSSITARNINVANIDNDVFALMSSGGNIITGNAGGGLLGCGVLCDIGQTALLTGDAITQTLIRNHANSNSTLISENSGALGVSVVNESTGFGSLNNAYAAVLQTIRVRNRNVAVLDNDVNTIALTGGNLVSNNFGPTALQTGNAANIVNIQNGPVNTNTTAVGVGGTGAVVATNNLTGAGSVNNASAVLITDVGIANNNTLILANNVGTSAFTGGNVVQNNGGGGCGIGCGFGETFVQTGNAVNETLIVNNVNTNQTAVALNPVVDVVAANSCTGADSINNASAIVVTDVTVANNNNAIIVNNINSTSSTGGNNVSGNTGGAAISTGGAALTFGVQNQGNSNSTEVLQ